MSDQFICRACGQPVAVAGDQWRCVCGRRGTIEVTEATPTKADVSRYDNGWVVQGARAATEPRKSYAEMTPDELRARRRFEQREICRELFGR